VVVSAKARPATGLEAPAGAVELDGSPGREADVDATRLLEGVAGVEATGAGGISSLPSVHGLSDDRLRVQVDGVDLQPACPNHMNSPLSYASPSKVARVRVYDGVAPVSVGGDSLGGAIQVESAPAIFAPLGGATLWNAQAGTFFRSNGLGLGYHLGASVAGSWLRVEYAESGSRSDNYRAGGAFKPASAGREGGGVLSPSEVGSSAYHGAVNRALSLDLRRGRQLLHAEASRQVVGFEGYPNQRMDMTSNDNRVGSLRYTGSFDWGDLEGRLAYQQTHHRMDMGPDRYSYGTGMPMKTKARQRQASVNALIPVGEEATLRLGVEGQYYTLFDWWPAVGGVMGPNDFWNVDYGQRLRGDVFAEWEQSFGERWKTSFGVRGATVGTDAAPVQGYDNGLAATWGNDAAAFNAQDRSRRDTLVDATLRATHAPWTRFSYEVGVAQKSRAPSLYQRYPWSTNAMAALMNNTAGDGNGYLGNVNLRPEVARTVSLTGDLHDGATTKWQVRATLHASQIADFIDARLCDFGQCASSTAPGFVLLQYDNANARLYGADLSARHRVAFGQHELVSTAAFSWLRGTNTSTGDGLYNIMPPKARLTSSYLWRGWSLSPEVLAIAGKHRVSRVRNEIEIGAYWLLNLRSAFEWHGLRIELAVENAFNRLYADPLGGAYVGQGPSMTTNGIPWGVAVPGRGRSVNASVSWRY
jgi:iron complex outermembrane receptor protein